MNYKLWLFKNNEKDSYEAFARYYKAEMYANHEEYPKWLVDATIKAAYRTRFINVINVM